MIMFTAQAIYSHIIRSGPVDQSPPQYGCCRGLVTEILAGATSHLVTVLCSIVDGKSFERSKASGNRTVVLVPRTQTLPVMTWSRKLT
jgi:hypothetical protein